MNSRFILLLFGFLLVGACSSHNRNGNNIESGIAEDSIKASLTSDDKTPATSLPDWAKELGLIEPQNMELVADKSHLTSFDDPAEGFNSITLVYSGIYDTAMQQAFIIARAAKLRPSKEYIALWKQASHAKRGNLVKGIAYMNYDLLTRNNDFLIYVQVDEKGKLTLSATDMKQLNLLLGKHTGISNRKKL
jgi:hypothetical protein